MTKNVLSKCLLSLESGARPRGGVSTESGSIPSLGGEHLNSFGTLNLDSMKFIEEDFYHSLSKGKLKKLDVLVVKDGATTGKVSIVSENFPFKKAAINEHIFLLRSDDKKLNQKFLFYFLYSPNGQQQIMLDFRGSTVGGISREFVDKILIPLPSISEQKKIAATLEQADAARQKRKQANQLTEQFLQSTFFDIFGNPQTNPKEWKTGTIDDVVEYSEYGTSQKSNQEKLGYPVLGMQNITYSGQLDLLKLSYVEIDEIEFKKLKLQKGDVIFNRTNSTELVGKTTYWNEEMNAVLASYLIKLRLNEKFNPVCFSFLCNSAHFKMMFMRRCKKAVGQSNISPTLLKEFPIYIPPLTEQKKFATLVEQVEKLRIKQSESERELENLFQSLMQRYFG